MKRAFLIVVMLLTTATIFAQGGGDNQSTKSETIVFISGQRYYVHNVGEGETLYSLSKMYGVSIADITKNNKDVELRGLQLSQSIKIPVKSAQPEKIELDRKSRKSFDIHTVKRGETLYAISRQHELSVAVIVEDNPNIDPSVLSLGQQILIRKTEIGKSSEEETIEELTEYKENLNRVAPEGYEYHLVKPQETLYSLLQRTKMSRKEFMDINKLEKGELRAGEIILIRSVEVDMDITIEESESSDEVIFKALRRGETLNISLLLPLSTTSGSVMPIFEEFYQGFLLGVEDLKERGHSVKLTLFDTQRSGSKIKEIVGSAAFKNSDLIVGPVYEELLSDVVSFAQRESIPVVSPLATLNDTNSGVVFQMAPIAEHKYDKIGDLLADSVRVTLIYTDNIDTQYEAEVKELLGSRAYSTHHYKYEHPSVIASRQRAAQRYNREATPSPSDMSPLIEGDGASTFFILADNETDVDRILSGFASAETGLRSRSLKVGEFTVFNNSKWNRYNNIDRAMFFRDQVVAFTSYHAKRDSEIIRYFDSRYVKAFSNLPSLYSYRGYDVARIFGEGLYSDIEYGMEGRTFTPLQTTYRFQKIRDKESRANQNWMRVNYKNNFTITIE